MVINNYKVSMNQNLTNPLKSDQITFRAPQLSDSKIMLDFINELSKEDIYLNANPDNLFTENQEQQYLVECLYKVKEHQQIHLLAFLDSELIGSVTITKQPMRQIHVGIFGLTIAKKWRGKGLGEMLARLAIEQAKTINIKMIILDAFAKNNPAINLYKKLGFTQYGFLPKGFVYQNKLEDKVLMYKEIA